MLTHTPHVAPVRTRRPTADDPRHADPGPGGLCWAERGRAVTAPMVERIHAPNYDHDAAENADSWALESLTAEPCGRCSGSGEIEREGQTVSRYGFPADSWVEPCPRCDSTGVQVYDADGSLIDLEA